MLSLVGLMAALAACGGGLPSRTAAGRTQGTVVFAEPAGSHPTYIFPLDSLAYFSTINLNQFQYLMWRPLYWFGSGSKVVLNQQLSLAYPPQFIDGNGKVVIRLKPYRWSDGHPVTARDVQFWMNLLKANKANWGEYAGPGTFPDNVAKVTIDNATELTLTLTHAFSPTWFTFNELSQITPIPQHAWDRTSSGGSVGNFDDTPKGAVAVYNFLNHQAESLTTYTTNPLWRVVDGPWVLHTFNTTGYAAFRPNVNYSGSVKPHLREFVEMPFTSETAEFDALRAGTITYGYVPLPDVSQIHAVRAAGFTVHPWYLWSMNIIPLNFHNPVAGSILRQLYVRQAIQSLINQTLYLRAALKGYGAPDYGPVPIYPPNPYASAYERANPYPFNPGHAVSLLRRHGWRVRPGGASTCADPGPRQSQCGVGVVRGERLELNILYSAGIVWISQEMQALRSSLSLAGIQLNLREAPSNTVVFTPIPCTAKQPVCSWQLVFWGNGWEYAPDNYPTGGDAFHTGAVGNWGSYSNPTADRLIAATHYQTGEAVLVRYQNFIAAQIPMLWMPIAPYQISAIRDTLHGATPQPVDGVSLTPEAWSLRR